MALGGKREGAGRKPGKESLLNKAKLKALEEIQKRIIKSSSRILNAQMNLAEGASYLYRIDKDEKGHNKKPELVKSQSEIEDYLAGNLDDEESYYYITTERPDNKAIDSLLDRTFGKAVSNVDVKSDGEKIQGVIVLPAKE